jgi:hypothetical protein
MCTYDVRVCWAPGHTGIDGNEAADRLADEGAKKDCDPDSPPTVSGIRSIFRGLRATARLSWWEKHRKQLSPWYQSWELDYKIQSLPELDLPRTTLQRLLAIRTSHGDFAWYHQQYGHQDAILNCTCGRPKDPEHLVRCRKASTPARFSLWPQKPAHPPTDQKEARSYLSRLMAKPTDFAGLLKVTEFYSKICVS